MIRKEKLRRHWMDRPPLPRSPVPCTGLMGGIFGAQTYRMFKMRAEADYARFDRLSPEWRERVRQQQLAKSARQQRIERDKYFSQLAARWR
ncbi:MAG: hypothetical protein E6Q97_03590 [Desulfurellales bacterium]|nr:MAG: hypothetical protein E6Q97_03590 [Desulfurellales bacterium]